MLEIQFKQIQYNITKYNRKIEWVVLHDTGNYDNGSGAWCHYNYFNSQNRNASADIFVDDSNILQVNNYNTGYSYHCGDGAGKYGITNRNSIGIEMCINNDGNYEQTVANTVELVRYLMKELNIDIEHVVTHYAASRKNCPQTMNNNGDWSKWYEFKERVVDYMDANQIKAELGIKEAEWKKVQIQKAFDNKLLTSMHETTEVVDMGTLAAMMNTMYEQLKK